MVSFKCQNCGGELSLDSKGGLFCPYCLSKAQMSDSEIDKYKVFRRDTLEYIRALAEQKANEFDSNLFSAYYESAVYHSNQGQEIIIEYLFYYEESGVKTYITKDSVVFIFGRGDIQKLNQYKSSLTLMDYPSADIKNLSKYFPTVKSVIELNDGGALLAINKPENVFPLFVLGSVKPEHVAWMVSRMENLCCVFEFSDMIHNGLSINSIFVNPRTHEAYLYGGWWNARPMSRAREKNDLLAIRKVASQVLGEYKSLAPKEFIDFVNSRPADTAYSDFEMWDNVIEKGFGGHKFVKFS